jgi:tRNA 2-thiouridine synthesizing protein D
MERQLQGAGKILTIILTEGPYRSQYADIAYKMAKSALKLGYGVKMFLYMDATHIPKKEQNPHSFPNVAENFRKLVAMGADIRVCVRCATARGHSCTQKPYLRGVKITNVYDIPQWVRESHRVISLG